MATGSTASSDPRTRSRPPSPSPSRRRSMAAASSRAGAVAGRVRDAEAQPAAAPRRAVPRVEGARQEGGLLQALGIVQRELQRQVRPVLRLVGQDLVPLLGEGRHPADCICLVARGGPAPRREQGRGTLRPMTARRDATAEAPRVRRRRRGGLRGRPPPPAHDAARAPLRGAHRGAVHPRPHRRVLPPGHRRGGRQRRRHRLPWSRATTSSPATATTPPRWPSAPIPPP